MKALGQVRSTQYLRSVFLHRLLGLQEARWAEHRHLAVFANDHIGDSIVAFGPYEQHLVDFLVDLIRRRCEVVSGSTILDVGANVGTHSIGFSVLADRVISFEIHPRTYLVLQANVFGIPNIETHNVGLSDEDTTVEFHFSNTNAGGSRIVTSSLKGDNETTHLKVVPFDALVDFDPSALVLVKIDVEGHEGNVIRGMRETLTKARAFVALEWDGNSSAIDELRICGYRNFDEVQTYRFLPIGISRFRFVRALRLGLAIVRGRVPSLNCRLVPLVEQERRHYQMVIATK